MAQQIFKHITKLSGVKYKGPVLKWDTVIQEKTNELGRYLSGRCQRLDFSELAPVLERTDDRAVRDRILTLQRSEARKRGIGKSTLHYLRKNARNSRSFEAYHKIKEKLALGIHEQDEG